MTSFIENLESRQLLSGAFLAGGVLHVNGATQAPNTILLAKAMDGTVSVSISYTNRHGAAVNFNKTFNANLVIRRVDIKGGMKDDSITIDQTDAPFTAKTRMFGFRGNDTFVAGDENDTLVAGAGNDTVSAGGGEDKLFGGQGADSLSGETGDDTLWGGAGNDTLDGGEGNDKLGGIAGVNTLTGGAGQDTFVVLSINDQTTDYSAAEDILQVVPSQPDTPNPDTGAV